MISSSKECRLYSLTKRNCGRGVDLNYFILHRTIPIVSIMIVKWLDTYYTSCNLLNDLYNTAIFLQASHSTSSKPARNHFISSRYIELIKRMPDHIIIIKCLQGSLTYF